MIDTGRARFTDGPYDVLPSTPGTERVVGIYPAGGRYRLELRADCVVLHHQVAAETPTADASGATLKAINRRNREFWALRTGSKPAPK